MKLSKLTLLVGLFLIGGVPIEAQETSLDLRKDGRVIADTRKDYLLSCLKRNAGTSRLAFPVSDRLKNKLLRSQIIAIIVPPGMTGKKYLLGIVVGSETLPEDFEVDQADFDKLRAYATSRHLAAVERRYGQLKGAVGSDASSVDVPAAELTLASNEAAKESDFGGLYSGYLTSELADTKESGKFIHLTQAFRSEEERAVESQFGRMEKNRIPWATPFRFGDQNEMITFGDLERGPVTRKAAVAGRPAYLTAWRGRSLIVVAEDPTAPFTAEKYRGLMDYLKSNNHSYATVKPGDTKISSFPMG